MLILLIEKAFEALLEKIKSSTKKLIDSFALGNSIKKGIPIAIIGPPNAGKSTLLNALLEEDKAIISAIAGTTRDSIEDEITINGIGFRFIDTGIRDTQDEIEQIGIQKTFQKAEQAAMVIYLIDSQHYFDENAQQLEQLNQLRENFPEKPVWVIWNKTDLIDNQLPEKLAGYPTLQMSAKTTKGLEELKQLLVNYLEQQNYQDQSVISNSRHYSALNAALSEIVKVQDGLNNNLSGDLLAIDLRQALFHLGEITGEVTNDELLGNIFANFCIGK